MHFVLLALVVTALLFGPQWWARYTFARHAKAREEFPGTGGELARHLLDRFGLESVAVELTERGDHYDPEARVVRLSPASHGGRSVTAVAVAAHEVGHALQHHRGEPLLQWRTRLVRLAMVAEKAGAAAMVALPVMTLLTRAPSTGALMLLLGLLSMGTAALVHLITLPVELDASFGKALPILREGRYLPADDEPAVRQVLRAAAFTYVAASLAGLLNVWRWLTLLRRR